MEVGILVKANGKDSSNTAGRWLVLNCAQPCDNLASFEEKADDKNENKLKECLA